MKERLTLALACIAAKRIARIPQVVVLEITLFEVPYYTVLVHHDGLDTDFKVETMDDIAEVRYFIRHQHNLIMKD